ncbi:aminoglycoside phosphotransferase family protein [Streptomyces sp. ISL-36]|uniref:aminoglycoside phosphotransferase family protein n=1 Tax=Streptomyces sp. ISL-36 TaxID=2819182 RepID=UPI001BEBCC47|nr:aminoglycoside phosphotransferase family protein [Streptomyces sp. ISL-36]MBT2445041.1 aminoglycoside phosphotransferase family protein [Streptomyces sp. ISL-36]
MAAPKMHPDEVDIDEDLVRRLVGEQFPQWARLPVRAVPSAGTDNAMYRLGDAMAVRLPRLPSAARQVDKEQRWLPHLAPHLPLPVPVPLGKGAPAQDYALPWSVYGWLDGENAFDTPITDLAHAAVELGRFGAALRRVDATGGPRSFRGGHVTEWSGDHITGAIRDLGADGTLDAAAVTAAWESVLRLPQWDRDPVWVHGDLLPGNLLARDGRLSAVIDFGGAGTGDPACDMMAAWTLFTAETRPLFREAAEVDDATWARGRGWALCWGVVTEHYYRVTNPVLATVARRAFSEALAEYETGE